MMGVVWKPFASRADRRAAMRPSIMSEGATMSAPARTWLTAILARQSRVLSLSTSWPQRIPQWPWSVYSHMHTSVMT